MATLSLTTTAGTVSIDIPNAAMLRIVTAAKIVRYGTETSNAQVARQLLRDTVGDWKSMTFGYELAQNQPPPIDTTES